MYGIGSKAKRLLALLFSCLASISFAAERKNILVLYSYHEGLPWSDSFQEGLAEARKKHPDFAFYQEYMDEQRLSPSLSDEDWIDYLDRKYQSIRFAGIIAESNKAGIFVNDHRDRLPRVPAAIYTAMDLPNNPETLYLSSDRIGAIDGTIEMALKQNPHRNKIVVILGAREADKVVSERLRSKSGSLGPKFDVVEGFSFEELLDIARAWTGKEIVFYTLVFSDRTGRQVVPKDILTQICSVSRAPVYTFWTPLMGTGVVGGVMVDGAQIAQELSRGLNDYFRDAAFKTDYTSINSVIDWRTIDKYDLKTADLSTATVFFNRPDSFFVMYYKEFLYSLLALFLFLFLLAMAGLAKIKVANRLLLIAQEKAESARKEAEELALHDPLTGLLNRRALFRITTYEVHRFQRTGSPVSLIFADIDHFKDVNDRFGHDKGDEVLKAVAGLFCSVCRKTDQIARWGGEEFMILCSDTAEDHATVLGEKLREGAENLNLEGLPRITLSFGIGELKKDESFDLWFSKVDHALYRAKEGGRNRVCVVSSLTDWISPLA